MKSVKNSCAVFITFSGNCKKALSTYQKLLGGKLYFEPFEKPIEGFKERPMVHGSLVSDRITIHGSDLAPNEGRRIGNYFSIYLHCMDAKERMWFIKKLEVNRRGNSLQKDREQKLIEITDAFDVRWVLGI